MADSLSDTVQFDVGGRIFKVLRDPTLSLHEGSLLKSLADDHEGDDPIFVEANPDLFLYVLDYHRHRKICIPFTVSREAVAREARTLGLSVSAEDITQEEPLAVCVQYRKDVEVKMLEQVKDSKAVLLADLVLQCAVEKAGSEGASFTVRMADLYEKFGCICSQANSDGNTQAIGRQQIHELFYPFNLAALTERLDAWASKHGFNVQHQNAYTDCHIQQILYIFNQKK